MNSKKVNWFFLTTILLHFLIVVLMVVFRYVFTLNMILNFIVSSALIVVPAFAFVIASGEDWKEATGFHRIRWSTVGMIILFTFLTVPLTTLINSFSMLFVENAVMEMSGEILRIPFPVAFFFMAVNAPLCEEIVYRGIVYRGYRRSGTLLQAAVFSAVLFAVGHMNFNQAAYAFVIGIMLVLLVEATGSLWASVIYHVIFNGVSVCSMYLQKESFLDEAQMAALEGTLTQEAMLYSIAAMLVPAAVGTAIAGCVLVRIAKNERRTQRLQEMWTTRHDKKERIITAPLVAAFVLCIAYMVADVILYKMIA